MAGQPGNSPSASATATLVGNAFVSQYYNVLHASPHNVHRFYTDESKLSRAFAGAKAEIVETQDKIQEKLMSVDLCGGQAEIKTVDSLASLNGSVLVMVTGALSKRNGLQCKFVQTFFLAPQEKGYFVLSDICRFLDGEGDHMSSNIPEGISVDQDYEVSPPSQKDVLEYPETHVEEREAIEVSNSEDVVSRDAEEQLKEFPAGEASVKDVTESVESAPPHEDPPVAEEAGEQPPLVKVESAEGAGKMSYASILREASGAPFANRQSQPRKAIPAATPSSVVSLSPPPEAVVLSSSGVSNAVQDGVTDGGDGLSVYVKNLPLHIVQGDLEKEFQKFGSVKPGGINLRNQKQGVCFAFIQFEDASSVQNAIQASPISIGGRQVYIEEKKPTSVGPSVSSAGRGRNFQGRGYQAEGVSGRGNFGGRSFGRGGYNSERDFSNRGRGGRGSYVPNSNGFNANGYRKGDNQVGNGVRPQRRGTPE